METERQAAAETPAKDAAQRRRAWAEHLQAVQRGATIALMAASVVGGVVWLVVAVVLDRPTWLAWLLGAMAFFVTLFAVRAASGWVRRRAGVDPRVIPRWRRNLDRRRARDERERERWYANLDAAGDAHGGAGRLASAHGVLLAFVVLIGTFVLLWLAGRVF